MTVRTASEILARCIPIGPVKMLPAHPLKRQKVLLLPNSPIVNKLAPRWRR